MPFHTRYTYDQNSNVIKTISTELRPDGSSFITTIASVYDSLDRTTTSIDNLGQKTRFFYDSRSNAVLVVDAKGNKSITVFDSLNRTITTKVLMPNDPQNPEITTRFWWDDNSRLLCVEDDNGNRTFYGRPSSNPSQTTGGYDQANRLVLITYPNSTTEHFSYDENDNITQMIDQAGNIITNTYDTMNRLVERDINPATGFVGTTRETYAYDGLGRIVSYYDNNDPQNPYDDSSIMCFYDSASNLLREVQSIGSHTFTIDSYYDAVGNRTQIRYPPALLSAAALIRLTV